MDSNIILDEDTDIFYCKGGLCVCCIKKSIKINLVYVEWLITPNTKSNTYYTSTIALYLCDSCLIFCPNTTYGNLEYDGLDIILKKIKNKNIVSKL